MMKDLADVAIAEGRSNPPHIAARVDMHENAVPAAIAAPNRQRFVVVFDAEDSAQGWFQRFAFRDSQR
jgi:hypothetical protein